MSDDTNIELERAKSIKNVEEGDCLKKEDKSFNSEIHFYKEGPDEEHVFTI